MTASPTAPRILVIEDEQPLRRFLRATLQAHGYDVTEAGDAAEALRSLAAGPPALILLDLGLPDTDGLEFLGQFRAWSAVPVIVLSARGQETDKVRALDQGADDYLTKPFAVGELLARVRVALRHAAQRVTGTGSEYRAGIGGRTLVVDLARRSVQILEQCETRDVRLTPREYRMLEVLVRNAGRVVTHAQILREVWGPAHESDLHYLRVYAGQLRHKLEQDPTRPRFLSTEPGVGYRLLEGEAPAG